MTNIIDLTVKVAKDADILKWAGNDLIRLGHVGTHLDTYLKTNIPLEYFKSRGKLVTVLNKKVIELSDVNLADLNEGDFLIFRTGRMENYAYATKEYMEDHPIISDELMNVLLSKKLHFLGIDAPGIKEGLEHGKADKLFEDNGCYVIENLTNLDCLAKYDEFDVYTMWLDDHDATGLKVRVIAYTK